MKSEDAENEIFLRMICSLHSSLFTLNSDCKTVFLLNYLCAYRFDSAFRQIVICLYVAWNRVTNSVHQGSLWEGAVSQRLTEGESPVFFDAVSYEALVIDQRSLLQSASRPAPSQREPLVHTAKLQFFDTHRNSGWTKEKRHGANRVFVVDDNGLEPLTLRTSSACSTS